MVIGGVPLTVVQSIVTLYPSRTYTGVPIVTLLFPSMILSGLLICGPSSISGGSPERNKDYDIINLTAFQILFYKVLARSSYMFMLIIRKCTLAYTRRKILAFSGVPSSILKPKLYYSLFDIFIKPGEH